jgi:hybrid cluster-associated redox disulfide protein
MKKITKDTTLAEIMTKESAKVILAKHRVPCLTCPMAQFEIQELTIGDVCKMYSIDLKKLLEDLNNSAK